MPEADRFLLLPGWLDSESAHWQSRWEALYGWRRVEQADWRWPRRGDWMARLDEVVLESERPAVLVAHSLGCHLVAAWATHSRHVSRVRAALLVAIPDIERDDTPANLLGWRPMVRAKLPFAAMTVISDDDPYCTAERAHQVARHWGSQTFDAGALGHLNGASGMGDWPQGRALLRELLARSPTINPW